MDILPKLTQELQKHGIPARLTAPGDQIIIGKKTLIWHGDTLTIGEINKNGNLHPQTTIDLKHPKSIEQLITKLKTQA